MTNMSKTKKTSLELLKNTTMRATLLVALPLALSLASCASDEPESNSGNQTTTTTTPIGGTNSSTTRGISEATEHGTAEGG